MRIFKIKSEIDLKKIQAKNIEPIKITKTENGWDVEVEEDVDIDEIINPKPISVPKKETKKDAKKKKKKRKK